MHTRIAPSDAHSYIEISLYTQLPTTCFGQQYECLQGDKIQRSGTLTFWRWIFFQILAHPVFKM